jgi:hypothetical protein
MARDLQKRYPGNEGTQTLLAFSQFDMSKLTTDSQSLEHLVEALPIYEELLKASQRNAAMRAIGWLSITFEFSPT